MTRNAQALTKLIQELDRNLRLCDGVIAGAHWRLVEDIAGRRARAASTLRAMLRWYGEAVPPRRADARTPNSTVADLVAADRDLIRAYDRARAAAAGDAPEARLIAEQHRTAVCDRAELMRQVHPLAAELPAQTPRIRA
ncbi:hypothetical protein [Pseudooceanicola sp.]|uniref:hypothetical protein n=1 Tax=Pseudooceanicola sp. TaxID=1914328 RepID=UPI00405A13F9